MKRMVVISITLLLIMVLFAHGIPKDGQGAISHSLLDGAQETEITFPSNGAKDLSAKLSFQKGVEVYAARINFTPLPDTNGQYPTNVSIDIGDNSKNEWAFIGPAYGSWGKQTVFLDETDSTVSVVHIDRCSCGVARRTDHEGERFWPDRQHHRRCSRCPSGRMALWRTRDLCRRKTSRSSDNRSCRCRRPALSAGDYKAKIAKTAVSKPKATSGRCELCRRSVSLFEKIKKRDPG